MKKVIIFIILLILPATLWARFESPFPSSINEISIHNTHEIDEAYKLIRGMAPHSKINELLTFGITDVLIFKHQTRKEVDQEIKKLKLAGIDTQNIHHIPFRWKNIASETQACEQTIQALKIMKEIEADKEGRKLFLHCTVGEDRTGYLSGLWRMLSQGWTQEMAFEEEMCKRGYARGNPNKPWFVVNAIRKELTPLFQKMSSLIKQEKLTLENLSDSICKDLPQVPKRIPWCQKQTI